MSGWWQKSGPCSSATNSERFVTGFGGLCPGSGPTATRETGRLCAIAAVLLLLCGMPGWSQQQVGLITIDGAIGPITASYLTRALRIAAEEDLECLIIQLNTPGGFLTSTKDMVEALLASQLPTVMYVTPAGATAASAGTFITLAAHIAAMTPGTTIGAAHPVQVGANGEQDEAVKEKLINFSATYIQAIAAERKRNVEWAVSAVRESATIVADSALALNVVDVLAEDLQDLLGRIDGRTANGGVLSTSTAGVREIPMLIRERIFQRLWGPELIYILMLVAIFGIIGELSNPGAVFPGVVGAISLILVLFMAAILPINIAGLALVVLAAVLFIADALTPGTGLLTLGGVASFFIGSILLFDTADPTFRLSLAVIIPATIIITAFFLFIVGAGLRAQLRPSKTGSEGMKGMTATVTTPVTPKGGTVFVSGEYWNAVSDDPIDTGDQAVITDIQGLTLKVRKPSRE